MTRIILIIFALTFAVGMADYIMGGKYGLGAKLADGLQTFAPLFFTMAGFLVITPLLAKVIAPWAETVFSFMGADPGMFAGFIVACDNGAYPLARQLSNSPEGAGFGGMLTGSVIGVNVICMPLVMQLVRKDDRPYYFKGLMYGIITVPLGLFAGALCAGYPLGFICRQMPPLLLLSAVSAFLLWKVPEQLVKGLTVFARIMEIIALTGVTAAVFVELAGIKIKGLIPLTEALSVIGSIVILLAGVYVFMELFSRIFRKWLMAAGKKLQVNETSVMGVLATLANSIPTLSMLKNMDPRGKLLNCVFMSSGAFMIGDHLAYCGAVAPELLFPMIVTKFTAAFSAVLLALWCCRNMKTAAAE